MTRTRRATLGFACDVGGQVVVTLITFFVTPLFLDFTSQSLYGFWLASLSVLTYLGLVEFGIGVALTREIAAASATNQQVRMLQAYNTAFYCFFMMGLLLLTAGMWIAPMMPSWFGVSPEEAPQVVTTFRWAIIGSAIALPIGSFSGVLNGLQQLVSINVVSYVTRIIGLVVSVLLLYFGAGLPSLGIGHFIQVLLIGCSSWILLRKAAPDLRIGLPRMHNGAFRRLWVFGSYFQLGKIANAVALGTDTVFIGLLLGAAAVTPYALTAKLPILVNAALASKLPIALFPAMSQMFGGNEKLTLQRTVLGLAQYSSRIAFVGSIILFFGNQLFVTLWVGPEHFGGFWLNIIFVIWVLFDAILRGLGTVIYASGDLRSLAYAHVLEAVLSVTLMLSLIPVLGIIGAALGTTISRFVVMGTYLPLAAFRRTGLAFKEFLRNGVGLTLVRSSPGLILTFAYASLVPINNGWSWLVGLGLIACISNILAFEGVYFINSSGQPTQQRLRSLTHLPRVSKRQEDS